MWWFVKYSHGIKASGLTCLRSFFFSQMATKNPSAPLPFTTLIHMIIVKLSSANYLIWHSQILPLIESQDLVGHIDGSIVPPPKFDSPSSQTPNDKYLAWKAIDQHLFCLLSNWRSIASRMNCSRWREPPGLSLTLPVSSRDSATSYTPLDVQLTIPRKCTGFFVDLVLIFQVSLLRRWPSLRFHHGWPCLQSQELRTIPKIIWTSCVTYVVADFTITGRNWQRRNQSHWRTNPGQQPRTSG